MKRRAEAVETRSRKVSKGGAQDVRARAPKRGRAEAVETRSRKVSKSGAKAAPLYLFAIVADRPARPPAGVELVRAAGAWIAVARAPVPALTVEAAIAHDRVVRAVARVCDAVLPLRFGMSAESERVLATKLAPFRAAIREALGRVRGAVQLTMRVGGRELRAEEREAAARRGHGPGARFLARKLAAERVPEIDALTEALAPYVRDTRIERLGAGERPPTVDRDDPRIRVASHFASVFFLVPREQLAGWRRVVKKTAIPHVTWQVTGPWPPYAFAELR